MPGRIVVIGSANADLIVKAARLPGPGETVLGGDFSIAQGGKGANQAVAAARAGGSVAFIGRVGNDDFGREARASLARDGLDLTHLSTDPEAPTGVALIVVGDQGENQIAVAPGANSRLSPAQVDQAADLIDADTVVLLQLEVPLETVARAVEIASAKGATVILNPAPYADLAPELLGRVSILTPNRREAAQLAGVDAGAEDFARAAARRLRELGPEIVVITLGAQGAYAEGPGFAEAFPPFPVKAVDTTAAGDVFNGALAAAVVEGRDLTEAVRFAQAAAAISVTRLGAQPSIPRREEIQRKLRE